MMSFISLVAARSPGLPTAAQLCLLLPMLGLAACAVGPDYQTPSLSLPVQWGNAPKTAKPLQPKQLSQWWKKLGDQTLNVIVEEAIAGNLDVASAKARIREARASRRQAIGALLPQADGSASVTRSRTAAATSATGENITSNLFNAGLDASWEFDLFGANYRNVEASTYGVDAADEDLRSTLLTLIGDVTSTYIEARGYQARIALARRTAVSQRETESLTRTKLEAGAASAVDVAKAAALASSTEANIPSLEASYAQSLHRLGILAGQAPVAFTTRLARGGPIPAARSTPPAGMPADMLLNRPDVRKAERQLAQRTAKIGQAEAALYPSVSLTGNLATSALKSGDLAKNSSISWSFGPSLSVPILNGGELRAAVEVAQTQRDQYDAAFKLSVLTAMQDVENALVSLAQERIRAGKLSTSARSYREAARLSRSLYQSGSSSFLDVLDAERSLYNAEDSLLQSQILSTTYFIALNKALGGGWGKPIDASGGTLVDENTGPHARKGY